MGIIWRLHPYEKLLDFGSLYPARNIWSPSSKFIALNDFNWSPHEGTISILDVQTQEIIQTLTGQVGFVLKIVWSLDETEIISLDANQTITKWDVTKGQQIARVDDYSWVGRIDEQVAFDSSGALIAIADRVDTIRLFDTTNGVLKSTLIGHTGEINGMVWQPQGNLLATKTGITIGDEPQDGGTVRIWDGHTGQLVDLIDHQSSQINSIAWSPDGSALAIVSHRGQMQVWDSSHQRIWFSEQAAGVPIVSWSPHSYHIMLYFMAGSHGLMGAKLFHPVTGENSWGTVTNFSHDALAWTEDDQLLLNAGVRCRDYRPPRNCYIAINPLFDADKLPNPQPYVYERVSQLEPTITLEAHLAAVNAVQWNKNATYIAANDVDGELRVWQFSLNENQLALSLNDVVGINWSPDGQRLGVVKRGNTVEIWNVVTGELDLKLNQNGINHLLWSPDSAMLVTWGETQLTRIWNAHTGELLAELEHSGTVVWSPDSRKVAQNANGVVTIWGYQ
jgi:WD40 repeat protein